ncbi:hypothetical protein OG223_29735 [Streptomyces sp. NBC_01478]|uniref:NB-ARC domain-containing protein n=1 Tax=Streptomyces sp. NBC_01478 TaxID=2903882 RepID=UPI002E37DA42|nr:NB-ARC domain-containing protein [Streptomyces sp. NBC_01478]
MGGRETDDDPRLAFAAALTRLRRQLPDVSDETLAQRASAVTLPSGRRVAVNARRLGEWLNGQSVPRRFEAVMALVQTVEKAAGSRPGGGPGGQLGVAQWQRLWRAAHEYRSVPAPGPGQRVPVEVRARIVVGRPPGDAAALRTREELAASIDAGLLDPSVRQVLLTGAGGVGKSQLAAAAFHRAEQRAEVLLWVSAGDRVSVLSGYARAWRAVSGASVTGAGHVSGGDDETQADLFLAWLRSTAVPWLVVLDDIDDPAELAGLRPAGDAGRTVLVTRRRDAALLRPGVRVIPVGVFTPDEATAYLTDRLRLDPGDSGNSGYSGDSGDLRHLGDPGSAAPRHDDLATLAALLGHFPLALSQAAAFLIDTGMDLPTYLTLLADRRESVAGLLPPSSPADEHGATVTDTLQLALGRAESLAPPGTARAMLELISMFAPDGIPDAVLLGPAARAWLGGGGSDPDLVPERGTLLALRALHRLSLVTHHGPAPADGALSVVEVHALVQRAIRDGIPPDHRERLTTAAADALEEAWSTPGCAPETESALYRSAETLLTHADGHLWHTAQPPHRAEPQHPLEPRPLADAQPLPGPRPSSGPRPLPGPRPSSDPQPLPDPCTLADSHPFPGQHPPPGSRTTTGPQTLPGSRTPAGDQPTPAAQPTPDQQPPPDPCTLADSHPLPGQHPSPDSRTTTEPQTPPGPRTPTRDQPTPTTQPTPNQQPPPDPCTLADSHPLPGQHPSPDSRTTTEPQTPPGPRTPTRDQPTPTTQPTPNQQPPHHPADPHPLPGGQPLPDSYPPTSPHRPTGQPPSHVPRPAEPAPPGRPAPLPNPAPPTRPRSPPPVPSVRAVSGRVGAARRGAGHGLGAGRGGSTAAGRRSSGRADAAGAGGPGRR